MLKHFDEEFIEFSRQGLTRVQIAVRLGILCKDLLSSLSPGVAERGKELCQDFHENLMNAMIRGDVKADTKEKELQAWRLKTMFRDDWSDKQTDKDLGPYGSLDDEQLMSCVKLLMEKHKATLEALSD